MQSYKYKTELTVKTWSLSVRDDHLLVGVTTRDYHDPDRCRRSSSNTLVIPTPVITLVPTLTSSGPIEKCEYSMILQSSQYKPTKENQINLNVIAQKTHFFNFIIKFLYFLQNTKIYFSCKRQSLLSYLLYFCGFFF